MITPTRLVLWLTAAGLTSQLQMIAVAADIAPIVEVQSGLLVGASSGGKWLPSAKAAPSVKAGTKYRIYDLTGELGSTTGRKPKANAGVCPDVFEVELAAKPEKGTVAVAAPWNPLPRVPHLTSTTQPAYLEAAREFLQSKGLRNPKVKITQVVRIDLEGDGEEEVLLSATNYFTSDGVPSSAPAGSYSFVLLRRVVEGKVRTQMVVGEFYPKAKTFNAPGAYEIGAVLDLDGDGKLEVIVQGGYYEGGWMTIYRCGAKKIEELLYAVCGA